MPQTLTKEEYARLLLDGQRVDPRRNPYYGSTWLPMRPSMTLADEAGEIEAQYADLLRQEAAAAERARRIQKIRDYPTPGWAYDYDVAPQFAAVREALATAADWFAPDLAFDLPMMPVAGMAKVFHGSRHLFDQFDLGKIGAGEGAQVYGRGLYVAENPNVARYYMDAGHVGQPPERLRVKGWDDEIFENTNAGWTPLREGAPNLDPDSPEVAAFEAYLGRRQRGEIPAEAAAILDRGDIVGLGPSGFLYEVDLADKALPMMLDWDSPISQQSPEVRRALAEVERGLSPDSLREIGHEFKDGFFWDGMTGSDVIEALSYAREPGEAEEMLKKAGITGIRYLDGVSRRAGEGSRNFVVFDDNLLKILKRE